MPVDATEGQKAQHFFRRRDAIEDIAGILQRRTVLAG
jgi:hypothetical protein